MAYEYVNGLIVDTSSFMDHSITFGDGTIVDGKFAGKNTWKDWHLIPASRPVIAQAGVSANFVDIPGRRNGPIDMTEYLTGEVVYSARSGKLEFIVDNDHEWWENLRSEITEYLHGKRMKMVLSDDPGWYYEGRFTLEEWRSDSSFSSVVISYAVSPYKYRIAGGDDWLWDPFNFDTDRTDEIEENVGRL